MPTTTPDDYYNYDDDDGDDNSAVSGTAAPASGTLQGMLSLVVDLFLLAATFVLSK